MPVSHFAYEVIFQPGSCLLKHFPSAFVDRQEDVLLYFIDYIEEIQCRGKVHEYMLMVQLQ